MKKILIALACLAAIAGAAFLILAYWDKITAQVDKIKEVIKTHVPCRVKDDPITDFCEEE